MSLTCEMAPLGRGRSLITLTGEIDVATIDELDLLLAGLPHGSEVVVDMAGLTFMDSTGIRSLLQAAVHQGLAISLRSPNRVIASVIRLGGLDAVLRVETSSA